MAASILSARGRPACSGLRSNPAGCATATVAVNSGTAIAAQDNHLAKGDRVDGDGRDGDGMATPRLEEGQRSALAARQASRQVLLLGQARRVGARYLDRLRLE